MPDAEVLSPELQYVLLLFGLFVVPRVLQRYRLPAAVTSLGLGALAGLGFGWFQDDPTVNLLSTLGIVSLFLFAGLEVDFDDLRLETPVIVQHVLIKIGALLVVAALVRSLFELDRRAAVLVSLALLTPSTGFILDALGALGLTDRERFWVKSKAIATELVALAVMFVALQSVTWRQLTASLLILAALVALLPLVFRYFATRVVPYAPKSEFAFLLMLAVVCAVVTRRLGVYYLVGAFVVGIAAQRFRARLPALASEQMVHAVEVFATFFVPFYFFNAGLHLRRQDFGFEALLVAAGFLVTAIPLQLALVVAHRKLALHEPVSRGLRIGVSMLPTLVFTLVIAGILRDRFGLSPALFGGLIIYTLANTLIPGFALRIPPPEFETPQAPEVHIEAAARAAGESQVRDQVE